MLGDVFLLVCFDPGLLRGAKVEVTNSISEDGREVPIVLVSDFLALATGVWLDEEEESVGTHSGWLFLASVSVLFAAGPLSVSACESSAFSEGFSLT